MTACQLAQLIEKPHATSLAVLPAPLFYQFLQGDLQKAMDCSNQDYNTLMSISPPAQMVADEALPIQWQGFDSQDNDCDHQIISDASLQGRGAVCNGTSADGPWSHLEQKMYISCLELLAATLATKTFLKDGVSVLLQLDNQTAVAHNNNMEGQSLSN